MSIKSVFNSLSLSRQWTLGTLLAALPLVAAVAYAVWSLENHNSEQQALVETAVVVNRELVGLQDQVKELERSARQYAVLQDARFGEIYLEKYGALQATVTTFKSAVRSPELLSLLDELLVLLKLEDQVTEVPTATGENADAVIQNPPTSPILTDLTATFERASVLLSRIGELTQGIVSEEMQAQKDQFAATQQLLILLGVLALPASVAFQFGWSYLVAKPMNALSAKIGQIGQGHLDQSIEIDGPHELQIIADRLDWLQENLKTIESQKNTFLRHVTHELKTPLAAMFEASALLQEEVPGPLTEEQQHVVAILAENASRLQEMIHQLLNFNSVRLASTSDAEKLDVKTLINTVVSGYQSLVESRGLQVERPLCELRVNADPMLVEMLVTNLFSNALHYTDPDSTVRLECGVDESASGWWLQVCDEGPGIREAEKQRIFTPFYQGQARRDGSTKGSGLGLAIVGECAKHLGATIEIENNQPKGTCFRVRFGATEVAHV